MVLMLCGWRGGIEMERRREEEEEGRATHLVRRRCGAEDEALREAAPVQDGIRRQTSLDQKSKKREDKEGRPHRHGHPSFSEAERE